jgi:hypothetical protein
MEREQREVDMHYDTGRYAIMWVSPCHYCKNLTDMGGLDYKGWTCKAFPEGIDPQIVEGKKRHDEPIEGDHGLQYDPKVFEDKQGEFWYDWDGRVNNAALGVKN